MIQDNPLKKYWWKTEEKPKMEIKNNFSRQLMAWQGKTNDFATITFFPFPPFGGDWWHVHIHVYIYFLHKNELWFFQTLLFLLCSFCSAFCCIQTDMTRPQWTKTNLSFSTGSHLDTNTFLQKKKSKSNVWQIVTIKHVYKKKLSAKFSIYIRRKICAYQGRWKYAWFTLSWLFE